MNSLWWNINTPLEKEERHNHGEICKQHGERTGDYKGRLFVKRTNKGWSWYCHNCGVGGFRRYTAQDYISVKDYKNVGICSKVDKSGSSFTMPRSNQWFTEAINWLQSYGITTAEAEQYGMYCTAEYGGRLVLPIRSRDGTETIGCQLRCLPSTNPPEGSRVVKYLTRVRDGETNVRFRTYAEPRVDRICVVEDIVSAIKVGRYIPSLALLGTWKRLPNALGLELESSCESVVFWLDPDKADLGRCYSNRVRSLFGLRSNHIIWPKGDPKDCHDSEIKKLLTDAL